MNVKNTLQLVRTWARFRHLRSYELQSFASYWRWKRGQWLLAFQFKKRRFKARSLLRDAAESVSIFSQVMRRIFWSLIFSLVLVFVFAVLDHHLKDWNPKWIPTWLHRGLEKEAQRDFFTALGGISAAFAGLEMLKHPCQVTLYSDSEYLVKAMTEGWVKTWKRKGWWRTRTERPENVDLWQRLDALCQTHQLEFRWVKGHAGNLENERCDQLSMAALHQPNLPADEGYENKPETEGVRPAMQEGEPCRKCSTPVIKQKPRKKPKHNFYYEYYLWCPKCKTTYTIEEAKRLVEQPPSLF